MKKLIFIVTISILLTAGIAWACGVKPVAPIPPVGCGKQVAICFCDQHGGNCRWQWVCVGR